MEMEVKSPHSAWKSKDKSNNNYPTQANRWLVWATLQLRVVWGTLKLAHSTGVVRGLPFSTKKDTSNFTGVVPLFCPE
jgi:hypothetical protein